MTESNDKLPNGLNKTDENKEKNSKTTVLLSDIARVKNSSIDKMPDFLSTTEYAILNLTTTDPISSLDIEKTTINPESFAQTSTTLGEQIDSSTDRINKDELSTNGQNYQSPKPHSEHMLSDNKFNNKSQLFQDATKEQAERPVLKLRGMWVVMFCFRKVSMLDHIIRRIYVVQHLVLSLHLLKFIKQITFLLTF